MRSTRAISTGFGATLSRDIETKLRNNLLSRLRERRGRAAGKNFLQSRRSPFAGRDIFRRRSCWRANGLCASSRTNEGMPSPPSCFTPANPAKLIVIDRRPRHPGLAHVGFPAEARAVATDENDFELGMLRRDLIVIVNQLGRKLPARPAPMGRKVECDQFLVLESSSSARLIVPSRQTMSLSRKPCMSEGAAGG